MKVNTMTVNEGSRGDKSVIWTVSDTYVNWCQIVVGNPEYLERLYSGAMNKTASVLTENRNPSLEASMRRQETVNTTGIRKLSCPCNTNQATGPTDPYLNTKGPCSLEELHQWKRLIDLVELKQKCAELQRRLQNETFYKCRMAMTKDCKKQVFECPCVPRNMDAYAKGKPERDEGKGGKKGKKNKKDGGGGKDKGGGGGGVGGGAGGKGKKKGQKVFEKESTDNCIEYKLSTDDKKGSSENMSKKIFTFQTDPFCFEGNYFKQRTCGEKYFYPSGSIAGVFECDGTGMMYYPNGELAITVSRGKLGCRLQVMSKSGHNDKGQYFKSLPIALFDSKGNGVVYDQHGKIRLNYDQAEGILYDTPSGAPSRWQWQLYSFVKKRREQLQGVKEDDPDDEPDSRQQLATEIVDTKKRPSKGKGKSKDTAGQTRGKTHQSTPHSHTKHSVMSQIDAKHHKEKEMEDWAALIEESGERVAIEPKPVVLKLNQYLSLRIMKQDHIHLDFRPFPLHFHINLGVKLKPEVIERIDKVTMNQTQSSSVPCYFELLHTRTKSLRNLHSNLETIRKDNVNEDKTNFIKQAKLMGILKYITQMAMKKLNQDEQRLTKMVYKCQ